MNDAEGKWLSIMEYSQERNKSISTIRRYIKADRVKHKEINGKYFVWCSNLIKTNSKEDKMLKMSFEIKRLEEENRQLISDIDELKMLLSVYENKFNSKISSNFNHESMNIPPELP